MLLDVDWSAMKSFLDARQVPLEYLEIDSNYYISANDGSFHLSCLIPKDGSVAADQTDFETNYQTRHTTNSTPLQAFTPTTYTSKMLAAHGVLYNLYARNTGVQATVNNGSNTIIYTATFPWVKFIGVEVINAAVGESASLFVLDSTTGTYTGTNNAPLAQFGYTLNIGAGFYSRQSPFDADLYVGMQLKFVYTSTSLLAKSIGLNLIMNEVKVAPAIAITNPVTGFSY